MKPLTLADVPSTDHGCGCTTNSNYYYTYRLPIALSLKAKLGLPYALTVVKQYAKLIPVLRGPPWKIRPGDVR